MGTVLGAIAIGAMLFMFLGTVVSPSVKKETREQTELKTEEPQKEELNNKIPKRKLAVIHGGKKK